MSILDDTNLAATCDTLTRSLSQTQMREQRWILARQLACRAPGSEPTWQQSADLALSRNALLSARATALATLAHVYAAQSPLILLRLIVDRSEAMAIRMFAAGLLADINAPSGAYALQRALNDNATDQVIALRVELSRKLSQAGLPNNLRLLLCAEAYERPLGRQVLERIWRAPDANANAWVAVALTLLFNGDSDTRLVAIANVATNTAISQRVRIDALRLLYAARRNAPASQEFPTAAWNAVRLIWSRDGGNLKYVAGEILKLQGDRR